MFIDGFVHQLPDIDPTETSEWLDSLDAIVNGRGGRARARYLLARLMERAREQGVGVPAMVTTDYINTIPTEQEPWFPGDEFIEKRIRAHIRWNAMAMVDRANHRFDGLGGHLSTFASAAALYDVGFNHFFHGKADGGFGDQLFMQGHAAPGIYARAFLEGRLTEEHLDRFRREVFGGGLPSYPHPRRLPDFWEFPTVSMGLGPLNAVYQARFNRYLLHHEMVDTSRAKVWCFVGDGEMDEPEAMAGLSIAAREQLDNLIFVVNCNLQRLDGPVRGNGKIIQELEATFRGAGWNVVKVIWGQGWDELLARDVDGALVNKMNTTVDGEFQKYAVESGAYIREHFFGPDPRLQQMVAHLSDDDLQRLPRGGHDYRKLYAGYKMAVEHRGSPTVILAKTIKGWTLGAGLEARNATHQIKKLDAEALKAFRDRLYLEIPDHELDDGDPPYWHPGKDSPEYEYLMARRKVLNGSMPERVVRAKPVRLPPAEPYEEFFAGTGEKVQASTTSAFARLLRNLLRDEGIGTRVVPIIPDEARTFGLDALFREYKIYAPFGQKYEPVDASLLLSYQEARDGRLLEEGITEAGSMASLTAAGTAYATWGQPMIPFFIFYSMFGFQRVGDLIWSFGDQRGRGFLMGATAGRTTLTGEGLQHCDGQSHLLASTVPTCRAYDPAFAYEVAVIVRDGIERMYGDDPEDVFYYITLYNETYPMPAMPVGAPDGIVQGLYLYQSALVDRKHRAQILASGTAMHAALEAQQMLADDHDVAADVWSATSYKQLREDALSAERWNRLHPEEAPKIPYVAECLNEVEGPIIAVSDFMKAVPDQIARFVPQPFVPLGTDGYGFSDTRAALRRHFEVDAPHIVIGVLDGLTRTGDVKAEVVTEAIHRYDVDPERPEPRTA
ncbi:MAG: pyruvate dehydrogenase (acetyl-transferring), homodimeric type [Actinobacteria bacterium]|nr:pyruvate dehydrogenase (acetyl-transferring), homodimeric type [Actinomycetota bacterium]